MPGWNWTWCDVEVARPDTLNVRLVCEGRFVQLPDVPARHRPRHFVAPVCAGAVKENPLAVSLPTLGADVGVVGRTVTDT